MKRYIATGSLRACSSESADCRVQRTTAKGEGLEALYDRFLIRQFVGCIEQEYAFDQMISSTREVEPEIPAKLQ